MIFETVPAPQFAPFVDGAHILGIGRFAVAGTEAKAGHAGGSVGLRVGLFVGLCVRAAVGAAVGAAMGARTQTVTRGIRNLAI